MQKIITDARTGSVCFSSLITGFRLWKELEKILATYPIEYSFIEHTKDIWVRDFMPIEITEGHFLKFRYYPSYLKGLSEYRTDWPNRCKIQIRRKIDDRHFFSSTAITGFQLDINLDGGNVIKCDDCVIITDRVFRENRKTKRIQLLDALEKAFDQEVFIIPSDPEERTGHADGMVRYIGNNTVLLNHYIDFDRELRNKLLKALSPRFSVAELHYGSNSCPGTNWAYLNYLQIGNHIIAPQINYRMDKTAIAALEDILKTHVDTVPAYGAVRIGGGLNCLSWTTQSTITRVVYDEFNGCI